MPKLRVVKPNRKKDLFSLDGQRVRDILKRTNDSKELLSLGLNARQLSVRGISIWELFKLGFSNKHLYQLGYDLFKIRLARDRYNRVFDPDAVKLSYDRPKLHLNANIKDDFRIKRLEEVERVINPKSSNHIAIKFFENGMRLNDLKLKFGVSELYNSGLLSKIGFSLKDMLRFGVSIADLSNLYGIRELHSEGVDYLRLREVFSPQDFLLEGFSQNQVSQIFSRKRV